MRSNVFRQLIILLMILAIVIAILVAMGVFKSARVNEHTVTMRVGGTTSSAVITYTKEDGSSSEPLEVTVPWRKSIKFPKASIVILTAGNPTQTGSIECQLLLDGNSWKHAITNPPGDKVSCGGIVP